MRRGAFAIGLAAFASHSVASAAASFSYQPPGELVPGSGKGRIDKNVYAPNIRFPIEKGPAYANSQVWGHGGSQGGGGSQCDAQNFSYPWRDNYCEERTWEMPLCPSGTGHQGQDIRAATCEDRAHAVVAVTDGTITQVGNYSVYLTAADGTRFDYLHMSDVAVKEGDKVVRGQNVGQVSKQFNGTPTTVHLHFNIKQNVDGLGFVFVPTYLSLVASYESLLGITPKDVDPGEPPPQIPPQTTPGADEPPLGTDGLPPEGDDGCAMSAAPSTGGSGSLLLVLAAAAVVRRRSKSSAPRSTG